MREKHEAYGYRSGLERGKAVNRDYVYQLKRKLRSAHEEICNIREFRQDRFVKAHVDRVGVSIDCSLHEYDLHTCTAVKKMSEQATYIVRHNIETKNSFDTKIYVLLSKTPYDYKAHDIPVEYHSTYYEDRKCLTFFFFVLVIDDERFEKEPTDYRTFDVPAEYFRFSPDSEYFDWDGLATEDKAVKHQKRHGKKYNYAKRRSK